MDSTVTVRFMLGLIRDLLNRDSGDPSKKLLLEKHRGCSQGNLARCGEGWDWNPRHPTRSGGVWILREMLQ